MTVHELIDVLQKVDNKDMDVLFDNSSGEYGPSPIETIAEKLQTPFSTTNYLLITVDEIQSNTNIYSTNRYLVLWKNQ